LLHGSAVWAHRLVYYAFDLLHIDGHDLRRCPIVRRKEVLAQVLDKVRRERITYVDLNRSGFPGGRFA
jgi:ATP-dependent DNA ligase